MTLADERRLVTVLFADVVGFTGRAESTDPEELREMQREYFATVSREVERYGGTVEKYIGDAVMAIFGAPQAHDDDAERALRAALRTREAVRELPWELRVRIGVNTGEVVGGPGTGPHAAEYTVSGDAVNVASRLQQAAEPDKIYVGQATRRLSAEAFAFAPLPEQELRGRTEGIEAWRLERELPERPRLRGGESRLVGRARELSAMQFALEEAAEGRGLVVALAGEAGIGKTRLALEIRQRAEANGFRSAWATARSYAAGFPYYLVAQVIDQLLPAGGGGSTVEALRGCGIEADAATVSRWAAVLDEARGHGTHAEADASDLSPAGRQRNLVQALAALLRAASERAPWLLILDDLHWADPASVAVVEELLDVVPQLRVAMLALYRSGWSHDWARKSSYQQLNLRALPADEARQLAEHLDPAAHLSSEHKARVLERSAGNPFFLEELLRGESEHGGTRHRLPETVHEVLLARLDALPAEARQTIQLAAVVGMEFSEETVAAVAASEDRDIPGVLRQLQREELIVPRSEPGDGHLLAFRHPLIHEVAYRSLLVSARRALHSRIARWLEERGGEDDVAALARHYRESDDPAKARIYLPLAGERAASLNANREARAWFTKAAEAFGDDQIRRAEMLEAAARQTYLVGDIEEGLQTLNNAIELYEDAGAEEQAFNARRWLGRYYWIQGNPDQAQRQIGLAIEGLERFPPSPGLAYAYSFRSQILMLQPDSEAGAEWARKAIAEAEQTNEIGALVHAYNNLGTCLIHLGDPNGFDYLRKSLRLAVEHGLPDDAGRAYANLTDQGAMILPFTYEESEALLKEALAYAQRTIPGGVFDHWLRIGYGEFLVMTSRWSEADRALDAVDWTRAGAYNRGLAATLRSLMASYRGRYDDAGALLADIVEAAVKIRDQQAVLPALTALAHAEAGLGNDDAAVEALRKAIALRGSIVEGVMTMWFLFEAVDVLTSILFRSPDSPPRGTVDLVSRFAERIAPDAALGGDPAQVGVRRALFGASAEQLGVLAGRLGSEPPEIETDVAFPGRADAAAVVEAQHRLFDAARIRLWLGEERGDADMLRVARDRFEELGALPYLARASGVPSGT